MAVCHARLPEGHNLSYANLDLKFFDTALQQAQRCFLVFQSNFGKEHPHTHKAKNLISKIHHNLACCYHTQGDIEKADAYFQMGIAVSPTVEILAEYAHFLIKHKRFQESLPFIQRCLQAVTEGELGYGIAEYPTVLPAIQNLIDRHPSHSIGLFAQGLAHYLQILCYQMCQQKEHAQKAIKYFELWIAQQPDLQQQEIFQSLKNSLIFQVKSISLNLPSPEQQLFPAVVAGNLNVVRTIIEKQKFSVNYQEPNSQRTALHLACVSQQRDVIVYLLSKLARFDIKDKEEKFAWEYVINTPLLEPFKTTSAIFTQKYSAAVSAGIFLNWEKVLRMAVVNNYLADVRFLIEIQEININSVDANPKTRYTALHLAVIKNESEIVKYLFFKGADINALDANKKTPLDYIKPEQEKLLALFKEPVDLNYLLPLKTEQLWAKLKSRFFASFDAQIFDWYIEPQGSYSPQADNPFDILKRIDEFLVSSHERSLLILGDPGLGKSLLGRYVVKKCWEQYQSSGQVPLFIYLPLIPAEKRSRKLLQTYLKLEGLNKKERARLLEEPLLVVLDGYDEILEVGNLYLQNDWGQNIKCITTCRSAALVQYLNCSDYLELFKPPATFYHTGTEQLVELFLNPFTEEQVNSYLHYYTQRGKQAAGMDSNPVAYDLEDYQRNIKFLPGLAELVTNPQVLSIMTEILPSLTQAYKNTSETQSITCVQIYEEFIEGKDGWLDRQVVRLKIQGNLNFAW